MRPSQRAVSDRLQPAARVSAVEMQVSRQMAKQTARIGLTPGSNHISETRERRNEKWRLHDSASQHKHNLTTSSPEGHWTDEDEEGNSERVTADWSISAALIEKLFI